jgi:hypothetical protein
MVPGGVESFPAIGAPHRKRQHGQTEQAKVMTTRKTATMGLIAGIVLGATATEGFNIYRRSHDSQIFQERARCKAIADAYVKENSTDLKANPNPSSAVTVTLDKVDYSPARNSCVAELETAREFQTPRRFLLIEDVSVQDLLSGETLFSERGTKDAPAGDLKILFADRAFDYVMKNTSEPIGLQEQAGRMTAQPKSAPASVTAGDEKGNPIPDSEHSPKSQHPAGK